MTCYKNAAMITNLCLMPKIRTLYGLNDCAITQITPHEGGRNLIYSVAGAEKRILRVSFLPDRTRSDYMAETEYIHYLKQGGASVADGIASRNGSYVETLSHGGSTYFVSLFEHAPGDCIADHHYRYRQGAPLSEYFFNCGQTLGKIHKLSKTYVPQESRFDLFDKYNDALIHRLIPKTLPRLKVKLCALLNTLKAFDRSKNRYGMVHFDFSDGNYNIDYSTGRITVFDFDNCCKCWYLYDLANLWTHGVGWVQFEPDARTRKAYMTQYFENVVAGYRSETSISDETLEELPLMIQTVLMENILDEFEVCDFNGEDMEIDEAMCYRIRCMEEDIPYMGFFDEIYDSKTPFECPCTKDRQ